MHIAHTAQAIQLEPKNVRLQHLRTDVYIGLKQYDKATEELKKIIQANPKHAPSYFGLGFIAKETDKPEEAILYYQKGLSLQKKKSNTEVLLVEPLKVK